MGNSQVILQLLGNFIFGYQQLLSSHSHKSPQNFPVLIGVLTICRKIPVGVTVAYMVRDFPNSTDQLDEIALTIYLSGVSSANRAEKAWKRRIHSNEKEFSAVPFRWKKRSTSEGTP